MGAFSKLAVNIASQDPELGLALLNKSESWKLGEHLVRSKVHEYQNLDEYLSDRRGGVTCGLAVFLAQYGSDNRVTKEEEAAIAHILRPVYDIITLTEDYFGWQNEHKAQPQSNHGINLANAVALYQKWHSVSEYDAKAAIKLKMVALEDEYCTLRDDFINQDPVRSPSPTLLQWFRGLESMMAGNLLWSITCPQNKPSLNGSGSRRHHEGNALDHCGQTSDSLASRSSDDIRMAEMDRQTRESRNHTLPTLPAKTDIHNSFKAKVNGNHEPDSGVRISPHVSSRNAMPDIHHLPEAAESSIYTSLDLKDLPENLIRYPSEYISTLPSKGVRKTVIEAFDAWYQVPPSSLRAVTAIVGELHNASIILDDIQDSTPLRRGQPAAHTLFGVGQAINSASFQYVRALQHVKYLDTSALHIFIDEIHSLHVGQGNELYWTYHCKVPSLEEYLAMVDGKTSALFRMCSRLMRNEATTNKDLKLEAFTTLMGRYFQIRDDYMNLTSTSYADEKGFCSDFDEGKYSLALVHAMQWPNPEIESILQQRKRADELSFEMKCLLLDKLVKRGSLEYTHTVLRTLELAVRSELAILERKAKIDSPVLRAVIDSLHVA